MPATTNGTSNNTRLSQDQRVTTQRLSILRETTNSAALKIGRERNTSSRREVEDISALLDHIAQTRLLAIPHPSSNLDYILQWAAFFATQVETFAEASESFLSHSDEALRIISSSCYQLLEMGPDAYPLLMQIFAVFFNIGSTLAFFNAQQDYFGSVSDTQKPLAFIFSDVVQLVVDITTQYGGSNGKGTTSFSSSVFLTTFGKRIASIRVRRDEVANYIWLYFISEQSTTSVNADIRTIRSFLASSDRTVQSFTSESLTLSSSRGEFTCEWFRRHLRDFVRSDDKLFVVAGSSGSGKTVLSGWIVEHLQRSGTSNFDNVLYYAVDADVKAQTTVAALLKGLLIQLFDLMVGDVAIYQALSEAYHISLRAKSSADIEEALWRALEVALQHCNETAVVIDGLDQLEGREAASIKVLERLHQLTDKHPNSRFLVLTQPLTKTLTSQKKTRTFTIEPSHVQHDIRAVVEQSMETIPQFRQIEYEVKERMISKLSTTADGSFVWVVVSLEILKREKTVSGMVQALDGLPKSINESLKKLVSFVDLKAHDTRSLLAWTLTSQRPLTLAEIRSFLEIDLPTCSRRPRFSDPEQDVLQALGPVVTIVNGTVRYKHLSVKQYFLNMATSVKDFSNTGAFPFMIKEAHYDLTARSLAYVKLFVSTSVEPSFEPLNDDAVTDMFLEYPNLEYVSTYWIQHFLESPMYDPAGKHRLVPEFQNCFSSSVLLALLEWTTRSFTRNVTDYELTLHIRETIVGKQTFCTLQSLITLAKNYERLQVTQKSSLFYYQAYQVAQTILDDDNDLVLSTMAAFLTVSSTITVTEKTEIYTQRQTLLKRIISIYKKTRGVSHDITITYSKMLADLYIQTKQFDLGATVYVELYTVYVEKYGKSHSETTSIYRTLVTTAERSAKKDEYLRLVSGERTTSTSTSTSTTTTTTNTTDTREIENDDRTVTKKVETADSYESRGDFVNAEAVLVDQWRSISEKASTTRDAQTEKSKLDLTLNYARFLKRQKRTAEAQTVLEGLWSEYRRQDLTAESTASQMLTIAKEMKEFSAKTSRSILQSVFDYYKRTQKLSSSEATIASSEIEEINREIVTTSTSSSSTATTLDEYSLLEIIESSTSTLTTASSATALSSVVTTCLQLTSMYSMQGRWAEAYNLTFQCLSTLWPYVVTSKGQVALPEPDFRNHAITLATRLGEAMFHLHQIDRAEEVYINIHKATKSTLKLTDEPVLRTLKVLSDCYEQTYQFKKWLKINTDIFQELKTQLGPTHPLIFRTALTIADFCEQHHLPEAEMFWSEVYTGYTKDGYVFDHGIPAAQHLLFIYDRDARWEPAEKLCAILWTTFTKRGPDTRFTPGLVEKVYSVYYYVLSEVRKASVEELYQLTSTYKETCTKVFGARNELTVKATVQLAQVMEKDDKRRDQAIALYEDACKQMATSATGSTMSATVMQSITESKKRLVRLYSKTTTNSAKATTTSTEVFQSTKKEYGWSDERTLQTIEEMAATSSKSQSQESITQTSQYLQTAAVETIMSERSTEKLIQTATTIAKSYIEINRKDVAVQMIRDVRRQIITGDYAVSSTFGMSMKGISRSSYAFIIAFEQTLGLVSKTASFSELLAELTSESLLYQAYAEFIRVKAEFEIILEHGIRLLDFYRSRNRLEEHKRTFNELLERFAVVLSVTKSATLQTLLELYIAQFQHVSYLTTILSTVSGWILSKTKEHKHQEAYELALYAEKFVSRNGGWASFQHVISGFEISLYLMGRRSAEKCGNAQIYQTMVELSRTILKRVITAARDLDISFIQMKADLINDIVAALSEQQNYVDLEAILTALWQSRNAQFGAGWSSDTIMLIGRRLVELRFVVNRRDAAYSLCEDIIYNLRRVWGPLDSTTLEMVYLEAELHSAAGEHAKALQVYTDLLENTLVALEDGYVSSDKAVTAVQTITELLKRSYVRNGGWAKFKSAASYKELYEQLAAAIGEEYSFGKGYQSIDKWSTKDKIDDRGIWVRPATFEFFQDKASPLETRQHKNNLRLISGFESTSPRKAQRTLSSRIFKTIASTGSSTMSTSTVTTNGT